MWLLVPTAFAIAAVRKAIGVAAWASRWHPVDVVVGPGTTITLMRAMLILGTVVVAVGLWRIPISAETGSWVTARGT